MLYLVPTPIGNLQDITLRAVAILKSVDKILAEDTRNTGKLLKHFGIETPMAPYHSHNEHKLTARIIEDLKNGNTLAMVSDAGTPAISDPGYLLVKACHENAIPVSCLPGPSAVVCALACAGIPMDRFYFEGFLPHKKGRLTRLKYLGELNDTIVFYESRYRLIKTLKQLEEFLGKERLVAVVKEISKIHETIYRGKITTVIDELNNLSSIKGEYVIVLSKLGILK